MSTLVKPTLLAIYFIGFMRGWADFFLPNIGFNPKWWKSYYKRAFMGKSKSRLLITLHHQYIVIFATNYIVPAGTWGQHYVTITKYHKVVCCNYPIYSRIISTNHSFVHELFNWITALCNPWYFNVIARYFSQEQSTSQSTSHGTLSFSRL